MRESVKIIICSSYLFILHSLHLLLLSIIIYLFVAEALLSLYTYPFLVCLDPVLLHKDPVPSILVQVRINFTWACTASSWGLPFWFFLAQPLHGSFLFDVFWLSLTQPLHGSFLSGLFATASLWDLPF